MSNYDKDLARAIALSLQEHEASSSSKPEIIDVDEEIFEDEDDLLAPQKASASSSKPTTGSTTPATSTPLVNSFLSERQKMEQERLARLKRLRPETSEENMPAPQPKRRTPVPVPQAAPSNTSEQVFWDAEFRPTAVMGGDPRQDGRPTFRLTEILGNKSDISFAIISSFSLDLPWIYTFFDPSTPVIIVAHSSNGQAAVRNVLPNWIATMPWLRGGYGCQHMKFMLLFYKNGRLRVVVSTANLIAYDWKDMENAVWLQDIPLRPTPIARDPKATEDFPSVMEYVLNSVNAPVALETIIRQDHRHPPLQQVEDLRCKWDWSKVRAHLVPSICGKHEGWPKVIRTGHPRLMKAIRNMGLIADSSKELSFEYQGSSIGNYSSHWMNEFYSSARGQNLQAWLDKPKKTRESLPFPSKIKIVFPTKATVQGSVGGEPGGGTIFCRRNQWRAQRFPKQLFHNSQSRAGKVLMHTKMIFATVTSKPDESMDAEDPDIEVVETASGWAYIGSHNFTPSAWGTLSGTAFSPVLNITNYELGVVFPIPKGSEDSIACWERPARKYGPNDEPWIQEESPYFRQTG